MRELINCTPHEIELVGKETIPSSGFVPCVELEYRHVETLLRKGKLPVPVFRMQPSAIYDLPEEKPGVHYIVPQAIVENIPERKDLLYPEKIIRDERGRMIKCGHVTQMLRSGCVSGPIPFPYETILLR